jgi:hypothetical protein
VKNARDSARQILSVLNCSSRGKKRRHDEPRSGAGSHSLLPPQRRMACGGGPGPLPLCQSVRPRGQRAPHLRAHHGRYSLVEAHLPRLLPAGVCVKRQGVRRQRQVAPRPPPLHPGCLKSQGRRRIRTTGSRPRKTSGSPRDCGASMIPMC